MSVAWTITTSGPIMKKDGFLLTGCPGGHYFEFYKEGKKFQPNSVVFPGEMVVMCRILIFIKLIFGIRVLPLTRSKT